MPSHRTKKIWISNEYGRSLFGWKIKEEIFAIFFILVILALANDENIINKVSENTHIQIFIGLVIVYCIYNRIPWSLAFILIFLVAILFSGFFNNVKGTIEKMCTTIQDKNNIKEMNRPDNTFMHLGARVFSWLSKDKNNEKNKSILKKVRFDKSNTNITNKSTTETNNIICDTDSDESEESDEESEMCKKVSNMFSKCNLKDNDILSEVDTDNETEPDTDREMEDHEDIKENLKSFMVEKMNKK